MTTRERNLATILLALLIVGGGFLLAKAVFLDPRSELSSQLDKKKEQVRARETELVKEQKYVKEITRLSPRLGEWKKLSLPDGGGNTAEAAQSHLSRMKLEYQQLLSRLLADAQFTNLDMVPPAETRPTSNAAVRGNAQKKPAFEALSYKIKGECKVQGLARFFEDLYRTPLLHQIRTFKVTPLTTSGNSMLLTEMTVEVLLVDGAEKLHTTVTKGDKVEDIRPGILPRFDDKHKAPDVLAFKPTRDYQKDLAVKNPFFPPPAAPVAEKPKPTHEDPKEVLPLVRLTMISYMEYYGTWVARVQNPGAQKGFTALLVADPPPAGTRYQKEREAALKDRSTPPEEPVRRWQIKDRYQNTLQELKVIRIDPGRVLFEDKEGAMYNFEIGSYLGDALSEPLDEDTQAGLKALSEEGQDAALKQVTLKSLTFNKELDGYEAAFVNAERWDEKEVLSNKAADGWSAPDTWVVKDRYGSELVKMALVKMDKDRIIFKAGKKYFGIKPDGNLFDALKKPLSEEEVKGLKLAGK
jgi:hypothetical protein